MGVILVTSRRLPAPDRYDVWCAVGSMPSGLDAARRVRGLEALLERAYDTVAQTWLTLARDMGKDATAALAHAPAAVANVSDFGIMLAWECLADGWARDASRVLVICDDPWLFRHLAARVGIEAGSPPPLVRHELALAARGFAARLKVALTAFGAALVSRRPRVTFRREPWLLVYGHPTSHADGRDAYFGTLMGEIPELRRVLHVDCGRARAQALSGKRTASLRAWGSPLVALTLPFARWRPRREITHGPRGWLVRRAAVLEGSTGQAAMIAWQHHCQERWLAAVRPSVVAWPWENHSWERAFVRSARRCGVRTVGYQHATVARREWNYCPRSNPDGANSLPDRIFCAGDVHRARLAAWGMPRGRMAVAGSFRFGAAACPRRDPEAPVFVALPFDSGISNEILQAIRPLAAQGRRFLVRDHPMSPFTFAEGLNIARAQASFAEQPAVAAVVYCATTVGLEAVLAGFPTLRFRPRARVPTDPMPETIDTPAASASEMAERLGDLKPSPTISAASVFAPPDFSLWKEELTGGLLSFSPPATHDLAFVRRLRQLRADPVLRRWLLDWLLGRTKRPPAFTPHRPPYLGPIPPTPAAARSSRIDRRQVIAVGQPTVPLTFRLHGRDFILEPDAPVTLFRDKYGDLETFLGLHRFAWLNWTDVDPAWTNALWRAWRIEFGRPNGDWPWHPYTAAERAINILNFAKHHGLPEPRDETLDSLVEHGRVILERLEYFGEHATGNHLANNGRGLYRIGLAFDIPQYADVGARILIEEAKRLFRRSGVLREGSSHYHALITAWYLDCLNAARVHDRPEMAAFEGIVARALSVMPQLTLPGRLPLVGDISPDLPPEATLSRLANHCAAPSDPLRLAADGWLRATFGVWTGLWHAPPEGWPATPGHGHLDVGGFEIHFEDEPIFVDVGRGAYGDDGDDALYRSATVHNGLTVNGNDPFPPNRPYYDEIFRRRVGGPPLQLECHSDVVRLAHHGFARLKNVGHTERTWRFANGGFTIIDAIHGRGRHRIERRLHTPLVVDPDDGTAMLSGTRVRLRVRGDARMKIEPVTIWHAYGEGRPGSALVFTCDAELPWRGHIEVDAV